VPHLALYLVEQQLPLYSRSRITEDGTADKKITTLQINRYIYTHIYIYTYIYISFPAKCMLKCACLFTTGVMI